MRKFLCDRLTHLALAGLLVFGYSGTASAELVSHYTLDSGFSDSLGNNLDLVTYNTSSSTLSGGNWSWTAPGNPGAGLIMDLDPSISNVYSFGMRVRWDTLTGNYVKLIDYKDQTSDSGLYFLQGGVNFYPSNIIGGSLVANTFYDLLITRDALNVVRVYVDGDPTPVITYVDNTGEAVPISVGGKSRFRLFHDDLVFSGEWSTGSVDDIRVWNTVLTPAEIEYLTKSREAITSATTSGIQTAGLQDQAIIAAMQNALGDVNGRLFNLRSGAGEDDSAASATDDGVVVGEGDGPGDARMAKRVPRSHLWEVFTTVNYGNASFSSISNQPGMNSQAWSPSVGLERRLDRHFTAGFALTLLEISQGYGSSLGNLDIDGTALSAYLSYVRKGLWIDGLYSFGHLDLDSQRNPGFGFPMATGETDAYTHAAQLNSGYNFRFQNNTLVTGPFIGLDYLNVAVDGYTEAGGGLAALSFGDRSLDSLVSRMGWSVSKRFNADFANITPQFRVSYERQNVRNNNGTSLELVNVPFQAAVTGQAPGQDYMVVGAGIHFEFSDTLTLLVNYQTQLFRQDMQAHYASLRLSYRF